MALNFKIKQSKNCTVTDKFSHFPKKYYLRQMIIVKECRHSQLLLALRPQGENKKKLSANYWHEFPSDYKLAQSILRRKFPSQYGLANFETQISLRV